ncbi:MAG: thiaminase II [Thermaerobacter sp.]|nr:thiaminase II [Thermaerobacter sp.]
MNSLLWSAIADLWPRIMEHPFLRELHEGTLDEAAFRRFLAQDYLYLEGFARVLLLGGAHAPSGHAMRMLAAHAQNVFLVEKALHEKLTRQLGSDPGALHAVQQGPATVAYSDFLMRHGLRGDFPRIVAALLPCYWIYREVGLQLLALGGSPHPAYQEWIETYAGEEYGQAVGEMLSVSDTLPVERAGELAAIFRQGTLHEHAFWQQAYGARKEETD